MKHTNNWKPSKFQIKSGSLFPSVSSVSNSYRMASYIAFFYNYAIPKFVKGSLLDLGCGNVPLYKFYKDKVQNITCVDWASSLHNLEHLDISCDLNQNLPIASDSFDIVICSDVLEHIKDPFNLFKEINRVLKPGGYLLLNYPFIYGIHEDPHDYLRYTEYFIRDLTKTFELEVVECFRFGNLIDILEHVVVRILDRIRFTKPISFLWCKLFIPSMRALFNSRMKLNNTHPYLYAFVIQKPF